MKRYALMALIFAGLVAPAFARQDAPRPGGPGDGPPPEMVQRMQQARDGARTQAMTAVSADHQAKINAIVARVKGGQITDAHDAAQQIDAVLSAKESQAVLVARDKMMADMRASMGGPGGVPSGGGPSPGSGPPPGGGPPPNGAGEAGGQPGGEMGPGGPGSGMGPGGQGGDMGPGGRGGGRHGMHAMRNDAGFALLTLSLDRNQIRSLFERSAPPAH